MAVLLTDQGHPREGVRLIYLLRRKDNVECARRITTCATHPPNATLRVRSTRKRSLLSISSCSLPLKSPEFKAFSSSGCSRKCSFDHDSAVRIVYVECSALASRAFCVTSRPLRSLSSSVLQSYPQRRTCLGRGFAPRRTFPRESTSVRLVAHGYYCIRCKI